MGLKNSTLSCSWILFLPQSSLQNVAMLRSFKIGGWVGGGGVLQSWEGGVDWLVAVGKSAIFFYTI